MRFRKQKDCDVVVVVDDVLLHVVRYQNIVGPPIFIDRVLDSLKP